MNAKNPFRKKKILKKISFKIHRENLIITFKGTECEYICVCDDCVNMMFDTVYSWYAMYYKCG